MIRKFALILLASGFGLNVYSHDDDDDHDNARLTIDSTVEVPYNQRIGGSGVIEIGVTNLDLAPIKKIVEEDLDKDGFDFNKNTFTTVGVLGYAGQRRNGMRIGAGAWVGYNSIYSDQWPAHSDSIALKRGADTLVDSIIQLHLIYAQVGLTLERSFKVFDKLNLYAGGMIGGGVFIAIEDRKLAGSAFTKVHKNDTTYSDSTTYDNRAAWAPLWAFDVHGGFTYSVTKWLHLGIDLSALVHYSSNGFQSRYGSFWTLNPGIKVRFTFGNSA